MQLFFIFFSNSKYKIVNVDNSAGPVLYSSCSTNNGNTLTMASFNLSPSLLSLSPLNTQGPVWLCG